MGACSLALYNLALPGVEFNSFIELYILRNRVNQ